MSVYTNDATIIFHSIFLLSGDVVLDTINWSSTRFACGADILNENGHKIASKAVSIKIDLPLPVVFWRRTGIAKFELSNNQFTSLAYQIDENYRIIFSNKDNNGFDGYLYLLTQKAELRRGNTRYYLDCDMIDHSSMLEEPFSMPII